MSKGVWKNLLVALALFAAISSSIFLLVERRDKVRCSNVVIRIEDSAQMRFVTRDMTQEILKANSMQLIGEPITKIDLFRVEDLITKSPYIKSAAVNSTMRGDVVISIRQLEPKIRVMTDNGYDFYADTLGNIIPPAKGYNYDIPLINGHIIFLFDTNFFGHIDQKNSARDTEYLKKLINFVTFIERDIFLSALVTQIYILPNRQIELITSRNGQTIEFGSIDHWEDKIRKTKDFFAQSPSEIASGAECRITVKYKDQILVKYIAASVAAKKIEDGE